ncbi:thermonuclease family protein [Mesorhizobium sp. J428]|uniref:thermonuclease family protein n=1 Tax=Mesorhizobium sp. J428 TaxID=2898440 RepID=UPI002150B24B|nr:thermonuclease family protein [Mesorhizobium sp. J428]MCR5859757.1 thermonuclease family protein [Mesorhizobium sp. J428]
MAAALVAVLLASVAAHGNEMILGRASVIDGDTIEIAGQRIRLDGIDAPEGWQRCQDAAGAEYRCGAASAKVLDEFLAQSRPTSCRRVSRDRYGRTVAVCTRADGADVASWLVRHGHALDWPKYSKGRYALQQKAAQAAKAGMWVGTFVEPWEARRSR